MAAGRSCWALALDHGQSDVVIAEKRRERDRRYQSYLATKDIMIDGVLETLGVDCVVVCNAFTASQDFSGAWRMLHAIRELPGVLAGSLLLAGGSSDAPLHHRGSLL